MLFNLLGLQSNALERLLCWGQADLDSVDWELKDEGRRIQAGGAIQRGVLLRFDGVDVQAHC